MFSKPFEYIKPFLFFTFLFATNLLQAQIINGAEQTDKYLPLIKNKRVALVVNQTSTLRKSHLVDSLKKLKVQISCIFAPEHGFRGDYEAGALISNSKDKKTGLPVISLYGNHKKPTVADLQNVDIVLFDIQDVGVRFYTYISTLHYVMEACAENNKLLIVLDRPNPNGFYVDGPILDTKFKSFVGMHPVPIVHGLTIGEYAGMINGEYWLKDSLRCNLQVIKMIGYNHNLKYQLPVKPSPNLPTMNAIYLYPSVCLFEGTNVSVGRGTSTPFECIGKPSYLSGPYKFTPKKIKGVADNPPYANQLCKGHLLSNFATNVFHSNPRIYLSWLVELYAQDTGKAVFFSDFFDKLAGTDLLRKQIMSGMTELEIRQSWKKDLKLFRNKRLNYLLYQDFTPLNINEE